MWFEVDDIETRLNALIVAGGSAEWERNTFPGQGLVQYPADPEGNIFGQTAALIVLAAPFSLANPDVSRPLSDLPHGVRRR